MRTQIRQLIEEARRPSDPNALDRSSEPAIRLATETIRLARLAASTHMILSLRMAATDRRPPQDRRDPA